MEDAIVKHVQEAKNLLQTLDIEKTFSKYKIFREFATALALNTIKSPDQFKLITLEISRFFEDLMLIDKAISNNLYHYIQIKLDDNTKDSTKEYLITNIDNFIKPRENKQNSSYARFGSGCLVYLLSYNENYTSKDEARALSSFLFNLSDTEIRNCTAQFEKAYIKHVKNHAQSSQIKRLFINSLLCLSIELGLEKKSETFDEFFNRYQKNSMKKHATTQKTYVACKSLLFNFYDEISMNLDFNKFDYTNMDINYMFPKLEEKKTKKRDCIDFKDIFTLSIFVKEDYMFPSNDS